MTILKGCGEWWSWHNPVSYRAIA